MLAATIASGPVSGFVVAFSSKMSSPHLHNLINLIKHKLDGSPIGAACKHIDEVMKPDLTAWQHQPWREKQANRMA